MNAGTPIPDYPAGLAFGSSKSAIEIELFLDLLCSAC